MKMKIIAEDFCRILKFFKLPWKRDGQSKMTIKHNSAVALILRGITPFLNNFSETYQIQCFKKFSAEKMFGNKFEKLYYRNVWNEVEKSTFHNEPDKTVNKTLNELCVLKATKLLHLL